MPGIWGTTVALPISEPKLDNIRRKIIKTVYTLITVFN